MIDLCRIGGITLIPAKNEAYNTIEAIGAGFVCDFYVKDIEKRGEGIPGGYRCDAVTNIDHHAPTERMACMVSSGTLALEYVAAFNRVAESGTPVVINHTDADSILSSGIMSGVLEPEDRYGAAAIAADHTGEENAISDLLQALTDFNSPTFSFRNLNLLLQGKRLEPKAMRAYHRRLEDRERMKRFARRFKKRGHVHYFRAPYPLHSDLFWGLLPEAEVILIHFPRRKGRGKNEVRVRLGKAAPVGLRLHTLALPNIGARWNAGSSVRDPEGVSLSAREYADTISEAVEEFLICQPEDCE